MLSNIVDGKIYILISDKYDKFYIGCTTVTLEERLQRHIETYEEWLTTNFKKAYLSSFEILKYGDYRMELIEDCPKISGWDLIEREQYHILVNYKDVVNIIIPGKNIMEKSYLSDTSDIYTCSCGANMRNSYKIRRKHSLSKTHRKIIREIHLDLVSNNPDFEFIEIEQENFEIIYEDNGITLNINY
jgi:hypothetical protein